MKPVLPIREKRHRLSRDCYLGMVTVTFTFCIKDHLPAFTDSTSVGAMLNCLRRALDKYQAKNWAYVFMPDHLHCILEGVSESSDLWSAAVCFKKLSGIWLRWHRPGVRWQKDFYDHIHRKEEDLQKQIGYLLANPFRKGLVDDWVEYPYLGSLDYDLKEIALNW